MTKEEQVALITYKPGWKFSADEEKLTIQIINVEDSRARERDPWGDERLTLTFTFLWDEGWKFYPVDFVYDCIHRIERHETAEWFRVDGVLTHDPHTTMKEEFNFHDLREKTKV